MPEVDLNLVRVFVAVYETGSVSAAAGRLHVTQPSVSHSLGRLRDLLKASLFTRTRAGMEPTAPAREIYPALRQSLSLAESAIATVLAFDPSSTRRRFRLALTDLGEIAFLPAIMGRMMDEAPLAELEIVPVDVETLEESLARGRIDAAICTGTAKLRSVRSCLLFEEEYDCLYRRGHPRLRDTLTAEDFFEERHIMVATSTGHDLVDAQMRMIGRSPAIALRTTNLGSLKGLVEASDLVATVPSRIARIFTASGDLVARPLPLALPSFEVRLHWWGGEPRSAELSWFQLMIKASLEGL